MTFGGKGEVEAVAEGKREGPSCDRAVGTEAGGLKGSQQQMASLLAVTGAPAGPPTGSVPCWSDLSRAQGLQDISVYSHSTDQVSYFSI